MTCVNSGTKKGVEAKQKQQQKLSMDVIGQWLCDIRHGVLKTEMKIRIF